MKSVLQGRKRTAVIIAGMLLFSGFLVVLVSSSIPRAVSHPAATDEASLLDGYRHVEVASVSDAMEKLTGQRMYMSHRMRPIFTTKFAGLAVTVKLKKEEIPTRTHCRVCWRQLIRAGQTPCTSWLWKMASTSPGWAA